jgi:Fascin domain
VCVCACYVSLKGIATCSNEERVYAGKFIIQYHPDGSGRWALCNRMTGYYFGGTDDQLQCYEKQPGPSEWWTVHLATHPQVDRFILHWRIREEHRPKAMRPVYSSVLAKPLQLFPSKRLWYIHIYWVLASVSSVALWVVRMCKRVRNSSWFTESTASAHGALVGLVQ